MRLRALKPLADRGMSWAEIGREAGCDWRTARKYLTQAPTTPPTYRPRKPRAKMIDAFAEVIDVMLYADPFLKAAVIHERIAAAPYGFTGNYQRTKIYVRHRRPEILRELELDERPAMHRRFEVLPGAQAQIDWGDEGTIPTPVGVLPVYSFHMTLSYSRDPFSRYTHAQDLATFWGAHVTAFDHFGGVPASCLYDRTKTVVRRHVGRGAEVPLHPEAMAFADHYGFAIKLCAPGRAPTKGRVERQVAITRQHVLAGRSFPSLEAMNQAWADWLPGRRAQVHSTHGEVIAVRAERDRAALAPLPPAPYVVCDRQIRTVGKDALVSFEASMYSVPWRLVRPGQKIELRVTADEVRAFTIGAAPARLATHARARRKGSWVVDPAHWDGLPDRAHAHAGPTTPPPSDRDRDADEIAKGVVLVARRALSTYDRIICHERGGR